MEVLNEYLKYSDKANSTLRCFSKHIQMRLLFEVKTLIGLLLIIKREKKKITEDHLLLNCGILYIKEKRRMTFFSHVSNTQKYSF